MVEPMLPVGISAFTVGVSGCTVWYAAFGRTVTQNMNGKKVRYKVQPISYAEIRETMFEPVHVKPMLSLTSVLNNLRYQ